MDKNALIITNYNAISLIPRRPTTPFESISRYVKSY